MPRNGVSSAAPSRAPPRPAGRSRGSASRPPSISSHRAHGASQASPSASRSPFAKPKGGTVSEPEEAASPRATSSRNGGRDHLGMVGDIKSERWARSFRNGGRHRAESARAASPLDKDLSSWADELSYQPGEFLLLNDHVAGSPTGHGNALKARAISLPLLRPNYISTGCVAGHSTMFNTRRPSREPRAVSQA